MGYTKMPPNRTLTVEYCEDGKAVSDFEVEKWLSDLIHNLEHSGLAIWAKVSTETPIHAVRVAVYRRLLDYRLVRIYYDGHFLPIDSHGRINDWPAGFCDKIYKSIEVLLEYPGDHS